MNPRDFLFLSFHTAPDIPPPQAFEALIRMGPAEDGSCQIRFSRHYAGREEIPEAELEAEGFGTNDDFRWTGRLPEFWRHRWEERLQSETLLPPDEAQVLICRGKEEPAAWLSPRRSSMWVEFAEELIQAVLEASGLESPLILSLGKLEKQDFYEKVRLEWHFALREVLGRLPQGKPVGFGTDSWEESRLQLQEWLEKEAEKQDLYAFPKSRGWYWLMNEDIWIPWEENQRGQVWEWARKQCPGLPVSGKTGARE
jgi:hypothetical protein